jgi:hypothetical protein
MPKEIKNNHAKNNVQQQPVSEQLAQNPNPRANENIRVRTEEHAEPDDASNDIGSEITDGEDA